MESFCKTCAVAWGYILVLLQTLIFGIWEPTNQATFISSNVFIFFPIMSITIKTQWLSATFKSANTFSTVLISLFAQSFRISKLYWQSKNKNEFITSPDNQPNSKHFWKFFHVQHCCSRLTSNEKRSSPWISVNILS